MPKNPQKTKKSPQKDKEISEALSLLNLLIKIAKKDKQALEHILIIMEFFKEEYETRHCNR